MMPDYRFTGRITARVADHLPVPTVVVCMFDDEPQAYHCDYWERDKFDKFFAPVDDADQLPPVAPDAAESGI